MKIDISNLIGDLVEATVKSLKEKEKEKENDTGVDPKARVRYTTPQTGEKRVTTYEKAKNSDKESPQYQAALDLEKRTKAAADATGSGRSGGEDERAPDDEGDADAGIKALGQTGSEEDVEKFKVDLTPEGLESRAEEIDEISKEEGKLYRNLTKKVAAQYENLDDEGKKELEKLMTLIDKAFMGDEDARADAFFDLFVNNGAGISENGKKFYLDSLTKFGGNRKLLGDGTKSTEALVNLAKNYVDPSLLEGTGDKKTKKTKNALTKAAKPELVSSATLYKKKGNKFTDEIENPELQKIFNTPPLDRIQNKKFQAIFCPIGEDGKPLVPSGGKNSRAYLEQSVRENTSLDATIEVARKEVEAGNLNKDFLTALEKHRENMQAILQMKIPSKKASQAISDSYAELFTSLHQADADMAPSVLKQFAEMALYDSELANGDQAYLPKDGSFPAGDKLVISKAGKGSTELVSFISVKYGKSGDVYGCPANASALQRLHPDENKRDVLGSYIGQPGYTLAIKDELIEDPSAYIRENLKEQMESDPSLKGLFSDDEIEELGSVITEYKKLVEEFLEKNQGDDRWTKLQKFLNKNKKIISLNKRLKKVATQDKMAKLVGRANANSRFNNTLNPASFISALGATNQIRTSDGYEGVEHNKQYIEDGKAKSSTIPGENDMDKWYLAPRMYRTDGRNGGGIQLSFIGDELAEKGLRLGILPSDNPPE